MKRKDRAKLKIGFLLTAITLVFLGIHFRIGLSHEKPKVQIDTVIYDGLGIDTDSGITKNKPQGTISGGLLLCDSILFKNTPKSSYKPLAIKGRLGMPDINIFRNVVYDTVYTPDTCNDIWAINNSPCVVRIYKNGKLTGFTEMCYHIDLSKIFLLNADTTK